MSNYVYKNPLENGYIKPKLTSEEHNTIFKSYKRTVKYEVYESETVFRIDVYTPVWAKIINILLYPILLLIHRVGNIKELNKEFRDLFNEKEGGHFYSDYVRKIKLIDKSVNFKDSFK